MNDVKNILIVRTDRIGDVVLTIPLAKKIKEKYPTAKITFLVSSYTKAIVENSQSIDSVLTLPENSRKISFWALLKILKLNSYDAAIVVYPKFTLAIALFLSKIAIRIGTGYRWFSPLFTHKVYEHRRTGDKHELAYNLNLLKPLGIKTTNLDSVAFDIQPDIESIQNTEKLLNQNSIRTNEKLIIIHPGSGGSSIDLPNSKFIDLTRELAHKLDYKLVITGSRNEKEVCDRLLVHEKVISLAGKLNLEELIAIINRADLLIANSTGPIHIAAALGKNVVGFYPKIKECAVERWGPYTDKRVIFSPSIDCANCTRNQCEKINCMDSINIDKVVEGIKGMLEK